jgi:superfamily I DNA/RNA helicase
MTATMRTSPTEMTRTTAKLLLGPPGCGKTHTLIEIVRRSLDAGVRPEEIGFLSFTRKAVQEAAQRAGREFNLTPAQMPFFRTLHALGYHMLGLRREDIMSPQDWVAFGDELGLPMRGFAQPNPDDGVLLPQGMSEAERYLSVLTRAHLRCVSLEQEMRETNAFDISWFQLRKMEKLLDTYRAQLGKHTFTDMLARFVEYGAAPRLRVLIIDEAQDLVPLQWRMVRKLMANAEQVIFAGDDDQAIHRWAGVEVELFLAASPDREVLSQSHRLPKAVFNLSQQLVTRIERRLPKPYRPTQREGRVQFDMDRWNLPLHQGSWTLMARTNALVSDWAEELRGEGVLFSLNGERSVPEEVCNAVATWRALQRGDGVTKAEVEALYDQIPKNKASDPLMRNAKRLLAAADPQEHLDFARLRQHYGLRATGTEDALDVVKVSDRERTYLTALERRGEDITLPPRIKLSTIHRMKGGEDDNVALYLGSTKSAALSNYPDDEHRVFYVGVTRAKENLHIIETGRKYRYEL